ncbi:MAG: protein kinase [Planctomycetota bacterium]
MLDDPLIRAAVERGFITPAQLEEARRALAPGQGLLQLLVARYLDPAHTAELRRLHRASSSTSRPGEQPAERLGPYELLRELARGGMGAVYVARREGLDREVALKVLLAGADASPEEVERFQIEARIAARLRHPRIVTVHDVGSAAGRHYCVMDYVRGRSLKQRIDCEGPLPPREVAALGRELADALAYAHARAVLHRDLKPHNVLLDEAGAPYLTDFGLAKDVGQEGGLTRTGQVMGTPSYMPPEQAAGERERVDRRADVYSLGATLYHALLGAPPFQGDSLINVINAVLTQPPPSPRGLRPELDRDLETIVLTCLEKEPEARYETAQALADDLRRYLADEPIRARPPSRLDRARKWMRRNRTLASVAGTLGALLVVSVVVAALAVLRQEQAAERARREAVAGVIAGAAEEHAAAWSRYEAARAALRARTPDELLRAMPAGQRATRLEGALGHALAALSAAQRWHALDPAGLEPRARAARALGEDALLAEQWTLAEQSFADLARLPAPHAAEGAAGAARVAEGRAARVRRVEASLAHLERQGASPEQRLSATLFLAHDLDDQTLPLVVAELDRASDILARTLEERLRPAAARVPELGRVLDGWVQGRLTAADVPLVEAGWRWLAVEAARAQPGAVAEARGSARSLVASAQRAALGRRAATVEVVCDALALAGLLTPEVVRALGRYLLLEADELRGLLAARALVQLHAEAAAPCLEVARALAAPGGPLRRHLVQTGPGGPEPGPAADVAREPLQQARARLAQGDPAGALAALERGPAGDASWERAQVEAEALAALARLPEALAACARGLRAAPPAARAALLHDRAFLRLRLGELEAGEEDLSAGLTLAPQSARLVALRCLFRVARRDAPGALRDATRAVELDDRDVEAWALLAEVRLAVGDVDRAAQAVERALALGPEHPLALCARGLLRIQHREYEAALADLDRAVRLRPGAPELRFRRGKLYFVLGRMAEARRELDRAIELAPGVAVYLAERGGQRAWTDDPRGALEDLDRALQLDPESALTLSQRGYARLLLDQVDAARADLDRALELDPRQVDARVHRATLRARQGDAPGADEDVEAALKVSPHDAQVRVLRAKLRLQRGDDAGAAQDVEQALRDRPDWAPAHGLRVVLARRRHDEAALRAALVELLRVAPRDVDALLEAAALEARAGRLREALPYLDRAVEAAPPEDPRPLGLRATVFRDLGERDRARADVELALKRVPPDHPRAARLRDLQAELR